MHLRPLSQPRQIGRSAGAARLWTGGAQSHPDLLEIAAFRQNAPQLRGARRRLRISEEVWLNLFPRFARSAIVRTLDLVGSSDRGDLLALTRQQGQQRGQILGALRHDMDDAGLD